MAKLKPQSGRKNKYGRYEQLNRISVNARKKLERHLKKFPNDLQAADALGSVSSRMCRKKPTAKNGWVKDSLRTAMTYVPYLNNKGMPIPLRAAEALPQMLVSHGQQIAQTRSNLKAFAQIIKFEKKAPFQKIPVVTVSAKGNMVTTVKHDSKLSNFTGKQRKAK